VPAIAPPAFVEDEHAIEITNGDGTWTVRKRHDQGTRTAGPGPGYVTKFRRRNGVGASR
jgi:hypothetical protein